MEYNFFMEYENKPAFAKNLITLRKAKGMSQRDLAHASGISNRMIAYYENHSVIPPIAKLEKLAHSLKVSLGELIDKNLAKSDVSSLNTRTLKKVKLLEQLPPAEQRKVLDYINALIAQQSKKTV
jgi:transcriptional regulator with XRE-family HTH domain